MKDDYVVTIPAREYEQLIRDSEKVRILQQAIAEGTVNIGSSWLGRILGVQQLDKLDSTTSTIDIFLKDMKGE